MKDKNKKKLHKLIKEWCSIGEQEHGSCSCCPILPTVREHCAVDTLERYLTKEGC